MNVIARHRLVAFAEEKRFSAARGELEIWYQVTVKAKWRNFLEVQVDFPTADVVVVGDDTYTVFNICFNRFRLIVKIRYASDFTDGVVFIKNLLTHAEYDKDRWKTALKKEQAARKKLRKIKRKPS